MYLTFKDILLLKVLICCEELKFLIFQTQDSIYILSNEKKWL